MTKKEARKHILTHLRNNNMIFPFGDEVVISENSKNTLNEWTFKGLLKVAYDLK